MGYIFASQYNIILNSTNELSFQKTSQPAGRVFSSFNTTVKRYTIVEEDVKTLLFSVYFKVNILKQDIKVILSRKAEKIYNLCINENIVIFDQMIEQTSLFDWDEERMIEEEPITNIIEEVKIEPLMLHRLKGCYQNCKLYLPACRCG